MDTTLWFPEVRTCRAHNYVRWIAQCRPQVLLAFAITTFGNGSVVTVLTYIAPILVKVTRFNERAVSQVLKGHTGQVGSVALGQLGGCEVVVSGSADKTVRAWEASTGKERQVLKGLSRGLKKRDHWA